METKVFFCGDLGYKDIILKLLKNSISLVEVPEIGEADLVYCVYGKGPKLNFKNLGFWMGNRQKYILHWIGTDVLSHVNKLGSATNIRSRLYHKLWNSILKRKTRRGSMVNLCCAPWLCDELMETGVEASYLPLTTIDKQNFDFAEGKRDIDFLSYLPQSRQDLYNAGEVFKLASRLKQFNFVVIVPDADAVSDIKYKNVPPNVTLVAKMTHDQTLAFYRKSRIFLRFTQHDGLSLSVIESLASRMSVMWTYPFVHTIHTPMPLNETITGLAQKAIENWTPNEQGQQFVLSELNSEVVKVRFDNLLNTFFI